MDLGLVSKCNSERLPVSRDRGMTLATSLGRQSPWGVLMSQHGMAHNSYRRDLRAETRIRSMSPYGVRSNYTG